MLPALAADEAVDLRRNVDDETDDFEAGSEMAVEAPIDRLSSDGYWRLDCTSSFKLCAMELCADGLPTGESVGEVGCERTEMSFMAAAASIGRLFAISRMLSLVAASIFTTGKAA